MNKETEIIVERFAQGITVRWRNLDGASEPSKALAARGYECGIIGKEVWKDVMDTFCDSTSDKVRIKLEYEPMED